MSTVDITTIPMTPDEHKELVALEAVVEKGLATFIEVGNALAEINSRRLYRATHSTFAAYAEDVFGITANYAYRMISAAKVTKVVLPVGNIESEAVARQLVGLSDEQTVKVFQTAVEVMAQPTAAVVKKVRQEIVPTGRPKTPPSNRSEVITAYLKQIRRVHEAALALRELHRNDLFMDHVAPFIRDTRTVLGSDLSEVLQLMADIVSDAYQGGGE